MKTPEDIKKALECCSDADGFDGDCIKCPYKGEQWCGDKSKIDALAYIQQLEATQPKWISVEERLPEKPCSVLVSVHGIILKGWYEDGSFEMISGYKFNAYDRNSVIAHWMPLPAPPKEE